jgi:hypothetical protein
MSSVTAAIVHDLGWVVIIEALLLLLVVVVAVRKPLTSDALFSRLETRLRPLASNPMRQLVVIGMLAFGVRAALLPFVSPPEPYLHDEHSLLLLGETLTSGRLANPPHPLWPHFESIHVSQQPTYSSTFFVGRGLPHAFGMILGHPWIGVWLSVIGMCIAICWALQAWAGPRWAFVVSVVSVLHFATLNYWINSYWGAALTACGGALVIGALPRVLRTRRARYSWILGLGIILLMTTRPFEGLLLCMPVALVMLVWIAREWRKSLPGLIESVIAPVCLCTFFGTALLLLQAKAVTGSATLLPYDLNRQQYATAPAFLFSPPYQGPKMGDARTRKFYEWEQQAHLRRNSLRGLATVAAARVRQLAIFFITPALALPFLAGLDIRRSRRSRFLAAALLLMLAGFIVETWGFPHYFSPGLILVLALAALGFERIRTLEWRGRPSGLFLSRALPLLAAVVVIYPAAASLLGFRLINHTPAKYVCCELNTNTRRAAIIRHLNDSPGRDLVIVRYSPDYDVQDEWIYNAADIDASPIVWARDLGEEKNRALVKYYSYRKVWRLELLPGEAPRLEHYSLAKGLTQPPL